MALYKAKHISCTCCNQRRNCNGDINQTVIFKTMEKEPICPHCSEENNISDCELWNLYEEEVHEVMCNSCNEKFFVRSSADWLFQSAKSDSEL